MIWLGDYLRVQNIRDKGTAEQSANQCKEPLAALKPMARTSLRLKASKAAADIGSCHGRQM
jgi:hypothetical protein